jgi:hypothetical protein
MVTAQDKEVLRVLDLEGKQQADRLQRLFATVYIVAQEQVIGLRRESTVLEQTQEVVILSVDIAYRKRVKKVKGYQDHHRDSHPFGEREGFTVCAFFKLMQVYTYHRF